MLYTPSIPNLDFNKNCCNLVKSLGVTTTFKPIFIIYIYITLITGFPICVSSFCRYLHTNS